VGLEREADLTEVPTLVDLARSDFERKVLSFVSADIPIGKSFIMPPAVPPERVETIRRAFEATLSDPEFLADAKASEADVHLIPGTQVHALVRSIVMTPAEVVRTAQDLMAGERTAPPPPWSSPAPAPAGAAPPPRPGRARP